MFFAVGVALKCQIFSGGNLSNQIMILGCRADAGAEHICQEKSEYLPGVSNFSFHIHCLKKYQVV